MKKWIFALLAYFSLLSLAHAAVDADNLLPAEQAFVPTVNVSDSGIDVQFSIAEGYYLYQSKITADTLPKNLLRNPATFSTGESKEDEFFGKQTVYHHTANIHWAHQQTAPTSYKLTLRYQGCAHVGICFPPVDTEFTIHGPGTYQTNVAPVSTKDLFTKKLSGNIQAANEAAQDVPLSYTAANEHYTLSNQDLPLNLLKFFLLGLGLSFTACMYPLIPIVSSIIVGDQSDSKKRAFVLSLSYVQGLALTYTLVGILAGLTGALLTVWLQQAWVVLSASGLMVLLSLAMFGIFNVQLPTAWQSYFQNQSNQLSGGKISSVFVMGMISALIIGPCVAPPLAFVLGYIGKTGDALLGGLALYALALGMGTPLLLVGTFGGHILPRAGNWMNGIKYMFGILLLAVALYLATPFLPYTLTVALYSALLIAPALYLFWRLPSISGSLKWVTGMLGTVLLANGVWFATQSVRQQNTVLHEFLTLYPSSNELHQRFTDPDALQQAIQAAFAENSNQPVLLDFYANWCVSCKEMQSKTFNDRHVQAAVPMNRMLQIDVTANTPEQQALLKQYNLFGPPGLFVLHADGRRSKALLGFAPADEFILWYQNNSH